MLLTTPPLLVCLDLQQGFLDEGPLQAPQAPRALIECARLLSFARARRWRIAHCYLHRDCEPFRIERRQARPIPGFQPRVDEPVIERTTLSGYGHKAFPSLVEEAPSRTALVACLSASLTFMATAFDAFEHGHRFIVAAEALAGQAGLEADADQHEAVARDVAARLGFPVGARFSGGDFTTPLLSPGEENHGTHAKA